jgi:hypothetical protein
MHIFMADSLLQLNWPEVSVSVWLKRFAAMLDEYREPSQSCASAYVTSPP